MDKVRQTSKEVKLKQWTEIITTCRKSGMSKRSWCEENGINEKRFYYWQRKLREMALEAHRNTEITSVSPVVTKEIFKFVNVSSMISDKSISNPGTIINVCGMQVEVYDTASEDMIKLSLKAVLESC